MSTPTKIELSVEESIQYAQQTAYWDGFVAGASSAAEHVKRTFLRDILSSRKSNPPAQQPEPPKE